MEYIRFQILSLFFFCRDEKKRGIAKRYLHSAVIISGLMLVYGGNIHNDTISYHGSKCRSSSFLAYDIGKRIVLHTD